MGIATNLYREWQCRFMTASNNRIDIANLIAPCYYDLHRDIKEHRHTFINLPGGRGSAKSSFVALEIVLGIMRSKTGLENAIVLRLVGATLRESVFSQIQWAIDNLGVTHLWESKVSPLQFVYKPTGQTIIFRGLDCASKLKSIKPKKGYFSFIWFEEFAELDSELLLRSVQQSVMRGGQDFTVFRSFNPPISRNNWANMYIQKPDPKSITLLTNYTMVPEEWLGESFIYEAERLKEINPQAYLNEYMGEAVGDGSTVFPSLEVRTITEEEEKNLVYIFQGLDFGFAVDPACFLRVAFDRKTDTIFVLDEIYEKGLSNAELARRIIEKGYNEYEVICDSAEPKSISDLRDCGIYAKACHKYPGCVQYRIKWLQRHKIVVDPKRTPNACRELTMYSYPVDKNGNLESRLPDKDNHAIDGLSYSLNSLIYSRGNIA